MNDRDMRFCEEYLIDLDAKHAALRAGFSPNTAKNASQWINPEKPSKPALRKEIDRRIAERSRRTGVSVDRVVRELARLAFSNIADVIDDSGRLRRDVSPDDLAAVASHRRKASADVEEIEVRMYDKNRALELLGKHLGMFTENLRIEDVRPVIVDDAGSIGGFKELKSGDG